MKALVAAALVSAALIAPTFAKASPICGKVVLGQCDVDFCWFKFITQKADGTWDQYGLSKDGTHVIHDYDLDADLEAMADKNYCTDTNFNDGWGSIDVKNLTPAQ